MASVRLDIVSRTDDVLKIDEGAKNKWKWSWLEKEFDGIYLREFIRKLNRCGVCYCLVCCKELLYGSRGYVALTDHARSDKHRGFLQTRKEHTALPGSGENPEKGGSTSYGFPPAYAAFGTEAKSNLPQPLPSLSDRTVNLEAMMLGFLAEKSLPFAVAPDLLDLVKEMSKDKTALNHITMHRNSASYKTRFGVSKTMKESIFQDLKEEFFSLNMDESTNSSNQRIVTVLVNYMIKEGTIGTKHLSSYSLENANSASIFKGLLEIFETNNIPWKNLVSVLLDSCNVMRGKSSGLEVKIRSICPHLLDIDGDSCHHIHNAAKQFSKPFEMHVESLCTDIHNDLKWSPDLRAIFGEICAALNVKCTMPQAFISFRWLSVYDAAQDLLRLFGALTVFYHPFLSEKQRVDFLHIVVSVYKAYKVQEMKRDHIRSLQQVLSKKILTPAGKERKKRIAKKLFDERLQTQLVANVLISVLSQMKAYVKMFQSSTPLIHVLHDKQLELVKYFLSCFIKSEVISKLKDSSRKIINVDVTDKENHLPTKYVFMGDGVKKLVASVPKSKQYIVKTFETNVIKAYVQCSQTLQKKMPLNNSVLKAISSLDPACRGHSTALKLMKSLPEIVTNVISISDKEAFDMETHKYHVSKLREFKHNEPIDNWWGEIKHSGTFPLLSRMACALLTCFHGPKVESSFSMMNSIVTSETNRLSVQTFDAIQTVKYELQSQKKSAVEFFKKKDYTQDTVDKNLCRNMVSASHNYREELKSKKNESNKKTTQENQEIAKEAAKRLTAKAAKLQRNLHLKKLNSETKNRFPVTVTPAPVTKTPASVTVTPAPLTMKHVPGLVASASGNVTTGPGTATSTSLMLEHSTGPKQSTKRKLVGSKERISKKQKSTQGQMTIKQMFSKAI